MQSELRDLVGWKLVFGAAVGLLVAWACSAGALAWGAFVGVRLAAWIFLLLMALKTVNDFFSAEIDSLAVPYDAVVGFYGRNAAAVVGYFLGLAVFAVLAAPAQAMFRALLVIVLWLVVLHWSVPFLRGEVIESYGRRNLANLFLVFVLIWWVSAC
ncbi:hypothetical protein dsx2_2758 [Desulfovibrio sp. X2]|uniref:hypothetical protein n=1 Tax=Desulfovibrio sp. X2 TaxID=941449 RepID=UPI000358AF77|nr:hypothetical protein [Desulfovibrio sp. X2]EPR42841.1 hypothetical protein dsx2_2758 [Desulfovibrio sp. X2]